MRTWSHDLPPPAKMISHKLLVSIVSLNRTQIILSCLLLQHHHQVLRCVTSQPRLSFDRFHMAGQLWIVSRKSIPIEMRCHVHLCKTMWVSTAAAGAPCCFTVFRPFNLAKCFIKKSLSICNLFMCLTTSTCPSIVHPLSVTHSLSYQRVI
jgi:hypothetical protein